MISQNGKAAANEHGDEEEVKEVGVANPERESVGSGEVAGIDERDRRNVRQAGYGRLNPSRGHERRKSAPVPIRIEGRIQRRWRRSGGR